MKDDSGVLCHLASILGNLTYMRQVCFLLTGLLCAASPALAQVTIDLHALDALPGVRPPSRQAPVRRPAVKHAPHPLASARPNETPPPAATATMQAPNSATPAPPAATLPESAPPTVAMAPVAPPPPAPQAPPPPPPPISDTATSAATSTGTGLRVTFGTGESDLSPASAAAIHAMVKSAPSGETTSFNVVAYAAGTPEDPSTARRLSLARALAVRSALIADGIASARIYVRALGAVAGDSEPDRVDLAVLGGNAPSAVPASAPGQGQAGAKSQQP